MAAYWIVAGSAADETRDAIYGSLRNRLVDRNSLALEVVKFEVPENLKFGTFDDLIRMADELQKHDSFVESVSRRIERQLVDLDPNTDFKIIWQRNTMSYEQYVRKFYWDDAKFPRTRTLKDNVDILLSSVGKLDEEVRVKAASFTELKSLVPSLMKKDQGTLMQRDLIDVLTPGVVARDDFVETEHMTTVVVCVPRGADKEFLANYETLESYVVPRSAKKFDVDDKEGNMLWRVVLFKKALESFKTNARAMRFTVRDFTYSEEKYRKAMDQRSTLEVEKTRQETFLKQICYAAFSDVFVAWVHLKAMRVFVESVLRYGVPPNFAAYMVKPPVNRNEKRIRQELEATFTPKGGFGKNMIGNAGGDANADADGEYYPYVYLTFTPLITKQQ